MQAYYQVFLGIERLRQDPTRANPWQGHQFQLRNGWQLRKMVHFGKVELWMHHSRGQCSTAEGAMMIRLPVVRALLHLFRSGAG